MFKLQLCDSDGKLIDLVNLPDTSGRFHFYFQRPATAHDTKFILKLANAVLTREVLIDPLPKLFWVGPVDGNWDNAANWSCYTVPVAKDDVIINNAQITIQTNTAVKSVKLGAGAGLHIKPGVQFTIKP